MSSCIRFTFGCLVWGLVAAPSFAGLIYDADFSTDGQGFSHSTTVPLDPSPFLGPNWVASYSGTIGTDSTLNEFLTSGGVMRIQDWGGTGRLVSSAIDVSALTSVDLSGGVVRLGNGANASGEYLQFFYSIDGGAEVTTIVDNSSGSDSLLQWDVMALDVSTSNSLVVGFEFNANGANDGWEISTLSVNSLNSVPEPSSMALTGLVVGLVVGRRQRR